MPRDQGALILPLAPSPRTPFVIATATAMLRAADDEARLAVWRAAVRELTDPLLAAGVPHENATSYAQAFRRAVSVALRTMNGGGGGDGPPGTRHPIPQQAAA